MSGSRSTIKIGLLGAGKWGANLARAIVKSEDGELVTVHDCNREKSLRLAEKWCVRSIKDFYVFMTNPEIDAVVVATPQDQHFHHVTAALGAKKQVFVEKPIAQSLEQTIFLVEQAEKAGLILMVGHIYLYNNIVREIKRLIETGLLGTLDRIESYRLNADKGTKNADVLWALGPHDVSIIQYWLNRTPHTVRAREYSWSNCNRLDECLVEMGFEGGPIVSIKLSRNHSIKCRKIALFGSRKTLIYDDQDINRHIQIFDSQTVSLANAGNLKSLEHLNARPPNNSIVKHTTLKEPLLEEMRHFVQCIKERREPLTSGRQAVRIVSLLSAAEESINNTGAPVDCLSSYDGHLECNRSNSGSMFMDGKQAL